ncbi:MAG: hypothetical protein N2235_05115 [Fischerella sp.]|nr:hypothetical protein [Fischerella sp.]
MEADFSILKDNMNTPWSVIRELESNNSRLAKESIVRREAAAGNREFFEGCRLACDSMITFGVKKVLERPAAGRNMPAPRGLSWAAFRALVDKLAARELTGDAAQTAINQARLQATPEQWNGWYRRILIKDLRCGVSEKTINVIADTHPEFAVPVFQAQLAHDGAKHESKMTGAKMVEVKLDGVRVITVAYPSGHVVQYSRNGKELVNFEHIKQQISRHCRFFHEPMVLDGEVMSSSFQDLMKQVHRKSDVAAQDAVLHLFDMVTLKDFQAGICDKRQIDRVYSLNAWHNLVKDHMPNVKVLDHEIVDLDTKEGQVRFAEINRAAIDGGYEGIMVKDPVAPYECKRTANWLKIKPFIEVSLKAVRVVEGTGKYAGMMGAVEFEGEDDGRQIQVSVGSGWSDKDREDIWRYRDEVVGEIGEIRGDALTQAQDSEVWSIRFPRFKTWRGFRKGEKL